MLVDTARTYTAGLLLLGLCSLSPLPASPQTAPRERPSEPQPSSPAAPERKESDARAEGESAAAVMSSPLLDRPVRRSEYLLGPGDEVRISIVGEVNRIIPAEVTPEGRVVIPTIGVTNVLGLSIDDAEARVRQLVLRLYRNVDVGMTLARLRSFKVFLIGNVESPGIRPASSAMRVSELVPTQTQGIYRRGIVLRRANGDSVIVDLARFAHAGELDANPTLREGDAVIVRRVDASVSVTGRVTFPGVYEFRPGESLADLLRLVNGSQGFAPDAADTVRLSRVVSDGQRETILLSRSEATGARGRGLPLQAFDAIYVPTVSHFMDRSAVTILGEVERTGTFPIQRGATNVRELIQMAGGLTSRASLVDAKLRRSYGTDRIAGLRAALERIPPEVRTDEERRLLRVQSQVSDSSVNVVLDFRNLLEQGVSAGDQLLEPGDVVVIPTRRNEVTVLGAVRTPGILTYSPGRGTEDYVRAAGDFIRGADRGNIVVLKGTMGERVDARSAGALEPGDVIIIPFKQRVHVAQVLQNVTTLLGVVSSTVLSILTYLAVVK